MVVRFLMQTGFADGVTSLDLQVELSVLPCIADKMLIPSVERFAHAIVYFLVSHNIVVSKMGSVTSIKFSKFC
jgi:hypothetical protein